MTRAAILLLLMALLSSRAVAVTGVNPEARTSTPQA
jgi:hypothetical protein